MNIDSPILFFDGECNLCNGTVDFLLKILPQPQFKIASLQGETAKKLLKPTQRESLESLVFYKDGQTWERSQAIWHIITHSNSWILKVFLIFRALPQGLCDAIYNWVARNRYRLFGQKDTCRIPTESEKSYFLP